jgi:hypothetical protein
MLLAVLLLLLTLGASQTQPRSDTTFESQLFTDDCPLPSAYSRANLRLTSCVFSGLRAPLGTDGAALRCDSCTVTCTSTSFTRCSAASGGAIRLTSSDLTSRGASFSHCEAASDGGAVSALSTSVSLSNCSFEDCFSWSSAGSLYAKDGGSVTFERCAFKGCQAASGGGFLNLLSVEARTTNCLVLKGTSAAPGGGAVFISGSTAFTTTACVFFMNAVGPQAAGCDVLMATGRYESVGDRFSNCRSLAISGRQSRVRGSRFGGDQDLLGDFPAVAGASSEYLRDLYKRREEERRAAKLLDDEPLPAFVGVRRPTPVPEGHFLLPHVGIFHVVNVTRNAGDVDRAFYMSYVRITGSTFNPMAALIPSPEGGFGGAILVLMSYLVLANGLDPYQGSDVPVNVFSHCHAHVGGAVAARKSHITRTDCLFDENAAFRQAGSVVVSFPASGETEGDIDEIAVFIGCTFVRSICPGFVGALLIEGVRDAAIDDCIFRECRAGSEGGALGAVDANLLMFKSHFVNNSCGAIDAAGLDALAGEFPTQSLGSIREDRLSYVGGAVYFVVSSPQENDHNQMTSGGVTYQFATEECCFIGNEVKKPENEFGTLLPEERSYDVYVGGMCNYQSYSDRFLNFESMSIWVNISGGAIFRRYYSEFYDSDTFWENHSCATIYQAEYTDFVPEVLMDGSISYGTFVVHSEVYNSEIDQSQTEPGPLPTFLPPATPLGGTATANAGTEEELVILVYEIHSAPTASASVIFSGSNALTWLTVKMPNTAIFKGTATFNPSETLTKSSSFESTSTFMPSITFNPSETLPKSSSFESTSTFMRWRWRWRLR